MEEITFSIFDHNQMALTKMQDLLELFEKQYQVHVQLEILSPWPNAWPQLIDIALYHHGPDLSEVGSTWIGYLLRMNALRLFTSREIDEIKTGTEYFDAVWQSNIRENQENTLICSVPLFSDSRVIFYRHDLFKQAKIDERIAFSDFSELENTLTKLKNTIVDAPLVIPTQLSNLSLQFAASWVWNMGGDFLSADGTHLAFTKPEALAGFKSYFHLAKFLDTEFNDIDENQADNAYDQGKAAVHFGGFWNLSNARIDEVNRNLRVASIPKFPFVGGSNIVIWNHSEKEIHALLLLKFLNSDMATKYLYPYFGLPVSKKRWSTPNLNTKIYKNFMSSISRGRCFPMVPLWGLVEKHLSNTLKEIWHEVLQVGENQIDTIVESRLIILADQLQPTFEYWRKIG